MRRSRYLDPSTWSVSGPAGILRHGASVLAEHEALQRAVGRLRSLAQAVTLGQGPPAIETERLIGGFLGARVGNLETGESEGYFDSLIAGRPRRGSSGAHLRAEHLLLGEGVDGVRMFARSEGQGPPLALGLSRVLDPFQTHERAETRLLRALHLGG
jgi:hypothetical protein